MASSDSGIREALARLLSDGLVKSEAQRDSWVAPVSVEDRRNLTATRKVIAVEALRQAILCGDVAWEARVVAAQYMQERFQTSLVQETADSVIAWETANRDFHPSMIYGCPVRRLVRFTGHLYGQLMRYRHRTTRRRSFPRHGLSGDHLKIAQYTLQRDSDAACAAMIDHIESIARQAEKSIFGTQVS